MFNYCPLCESTELQFHTYFPDNTSQPVEIALCQQCKSLIPQYKTRSTHNAIEQQTSFHEEWWCNSTEDELKKTLEDLKSVVNGLHPYLGIPNPNNIVLEIGSGRGSLLRALLDSGYQAYGCEPASGLVKLAREHYALPPERLHEIPANDFIKNIIPGLPEAPKTIFLWHVLEHIEHPMPLLRSLKEVLADNGRLILQLPLLHQGYTYPEHYFFVTHESFNFISSQLELELDAIEYDTDNLFVTTHFIKKATPSTTKKEIPFFKSHATPSCMAQGVILRDQLIQALRPVIADRDNTIAALTKLVEEKISCIQAQKALIDDRIQGASKMEQMIRERDAAIQAQATLIDEQNSQIRNLDADLKSTHKSLEYYKNSKFVKIARRIRILN